MKYGDRIIFVFKGDRVLCFYIGKLESGVVFDSNVVGVGVKNKMKFKICNVLF